MMGSNLVTPVNHNKNVNFDNHFIQCFIFNQRIASIYQILSFESFDIYI